MSEDRLEYSINEVFELDSDNEESVGMKLPEEVQERLGLKPGDRVKVSIGDKGTVIVERAE